MTSVLVTDRFGVEVIDAGECLRLLAAQEVGRLGVVRGGTPHVFPVNYTVADGTVVFRSAPGTKLSAALRAPVVLEIDGVDPCCRTGWSVVVHGRAEEITRYDAQPVQELGLLPLHPWAGEKPVWVRIIASSITGRRITAPDVKRRQPEGLTSMSTDVLREQHRAFAAGMATLRDLADHLDELTAPEVVGRLVAVDDLLRGDLSGHLRREERFVYPPVEDRLDGATAITLLRREHLEIDKRSEELHELRRKAVAAGELGRDRRTALRRVLYALDSLIRAHLGAEEQVLIPHLERRGTGG